MMLLVLPERKVQGACLDSSPASRMQTHYSYSYS